MTAVEFVIEKLEKFIPSGNQLVIHIILQEAKELEKQQIIEANINGSTVTSKGWGCRIAQSRIKEIAEQYYTETYGK